MSKLSLAPSVLPLIKAILLGHSGEGKSGAIVPLTIDDLIPGVKGYELRVLDFDGKFEEIARAILNKMLVEKVITQAQHDNALTSNLDITVCRENTGIVTALEGRKSVEKIGIKGSSQAWSKAMKQAKAWEPTLTDRTIVVVDSLTYAAQAAANQSQELNGKLNQELTWRDYQGPQQLVEKLMTFCADLKAHVIVTGHQDPLELYKPDPANLDKDGLPVKELMDVLVVPISIGQSGRMKLPAQFNHMLIVDSVGVGKSTTRYLHTVPTAGVMAKSPFFTAKSRYPIEKGLVEYFALRG
jgi:hypothetical protein